MRFVRKKNIKKKFRRLHKFSRSCFKMLVLLFCSSWYTPQKYDNCLKNFTPRGIFKARKTLKIGLLGK